jgi:hypothetical protein
VSRSEGLVIVLELSTEVDGGLCECPPFCSGCPQPSLRCGRMPPGSGSSRGYVVEPACCHSRPVLFACLTWLRMICPRTGPRRRAHGGELRLLAPACGSIEHEILQKARTADSYRCVCVTVGITDLWPLHRLSLFTVKIVYSCVRNMLVTASIGYGVLLSC